MESSRPYIQFIRNGIMDVFWDIIKERTSFILLSVIAQRASRCGNPIKGLLPNQALIGDFKVYGMTEQEYRTAKEKLVKWGFINVTATALGTVATLLPNGIYDTNPEQNQQEATSLQRHSNEQATTIKNDNNGNNKRKTNTTCVKDPIPPLGDVEEFFISKDSTPFEAGRFHEYFSLANWTDKRGKKINHWKQNAAGWINRNKISQPKVLSKEEEVERIKSKPRPWTFEEMMIVSKFEGSKWAEANGL